MAHGKTVPWSSDSGSALMGVPAPQPLLQEAVSLGLGPTLLKEAGLAAGLLLRGQGEAKALALLTCPIHLRGRHLAHPAAEFKLGRAALGAGTQGAVLPWSQHHVLEACDALVKCHGTV